MELNSFHLASASQDEDQHGLDQAGGSTRAAADLAQDPPALELGVSPLAGAALTGVRGVDLALVARESSTTGLGIAATSTLRDGEPAALVAVVGNHPSPRGVQRLDQAVLASGAPCRGGRRATPPRPRSAVRRD